MKCPSRSLLLALTALAMASVGLAAEKKSAGSIDVHVSLTPAGSFTAHTEDIQGSAQADGDGYKAASIKVKLDTLDTGIGLRTNHMRQNYLETAKYPEAEIRNAKGKGGEFEGEFFLHGKSKKISGKYAASGATLTGKFSLDVTDFAIKEANYKGVGVENEVQVEVSIPIQK